ncbi:DUF1064 domain-containing protein [Siminovitchia terrae]|uniref:DUF1064 domain-containing protein n=1 Tax=Siminovitchia terrae TaxID=1914933 RepID=UPI00357133FC
MSVAGYRKIRKVKRNKYRIKRSRLTSIFLTASQCRSITNNKVAGSKQADSLLPETPRYFLQEAFEKDGKTHRKIEYIATLRYTVRTDPLKWWM